MSHQPLRLNQQKSLKLSVIFILFASTTQAAGLTVQDYLGQVRTQSPGYQANAANTEGAEKTAAEGDLYYMPRLALQASHLYDAREVSGFFAGSRTTADNLLFGVEKTFNWGLNAKLNYTLLSNNQYGFASSTIPANAFKYVQGNTQLDLTMPLWRNGFGKETNAMSEKDEAASLQLHYAERLAGKKLLAQAEAAYYNLVIARESVRLQQEVLERAKKILDWTSKRVNNHLSDKSDMLQAKASHQLRQIELETSQNAQRAATLSFNVYRNSSAAEVQDQLAPISTGDILKLTPPQRAEKSDDVLAAEQGERFAVANSETFLQKVQPDLSLFGSLAVNGVDEYQSPAIAQSLTTDNPMYTVGVKFSMPLYLGEASDIRQGRARQQFAAEANTRQKKLESDQTWQDLNEKFAEAQSRLKLAEELVKVQKEKLEWEKYRLNVGRTTTFQVLTFEQDFASALITRLKVEQEIIGYYSQMKVYAVNE
ncbi:MAG: TolC family protein [Bdellovibrionales bacterium]|nr:TolC family protein [Bdellovibrionales bacterium]